MGILLEEIKKAEDDNQDFEKSPFASLYDDNTLATDSSVLSSWTIRTEVEESTSIKKGILERSPLTKYSLTGKTIFLSLSLIGLVMMYIAERYLLPQRERSRSRTEPTQERVIQRNTASNSNETEEDL